MEQLLQKLEYILKAPISDEIRTRLEEEELTLDSFHLLDESDLSDLGFKMGARKILMKWSRSVSAGSLAQDVPPVPAVQQTASAATADPSTASSVSTTVPSSTGEVSVATSQLYDVEEILRAIDRSGAPVRGPVLVEKLRAGVLYDRSERIWMLKHLGRFLMENCNEKNEPSKAEKIGMVTSIINTFPVIVDSGTPHGYEHLYDPVSKTGLLEYYIRQRRSRSTEIKTRWTHKKRRTAVSPPDANDTDELSELERLMRERRPTATNRDEMLDMMARTRNVRRSWISDKHPDCTTIVKRYPRLLDMNSAVDEEFASMFPDAKPLRIAWATVRNNIINIARDKGVKDLELQAELWDADDLDEDGKTKVSMIVLPYLLVPPPQRGVKKPRLSRKLAAGLLLADTKDCLTVDDAISKLQLGNIIQPATFELGGQYFVKLDRKAVPIDDSSCFSDVVEFLLKCYYVFGVEFPYPLKLFYGLIETVCDIPLSIGTSVILTDFLRAIKFR